MRRSALASILCTAPLFALSAAPATGSVFQRDALRAAVRHAAGAAGPDAPAPIHDGPMHVDAALAHTDRPRRVLVGARRPGDLPAVTRAAARAASDPDALTALGVVAVSARSPRALVAELRRNPRVAFVEPDRPIRLAADPFDSVDPRTGIPFTWAFDAVHAGPALAAAGGGSRRMVATVDTGVDSGHPDLAGRIAGGKDARTGAEPTDLNGHGTFVAGLISAVDGNGIGGKGVAGATMVYATRASIDGEFTAEDLLRGILVSLRSGARVLNMSLAGGYSRSELRALRLAYLRDVLPVAASGNNGTRGNPIEFPGAAVGGRRGRRGIGLSVAAVAPNGRRAAFSTHNQFVSVAAPGASPTNCESGVFSTIPRASVPAWDAPGSCPRVFSASGGRWGYAQGTSFAAAIAAGVSAVVWQVEPRLHSDQVADVIARSARQTIRGRRWNEQTGSGVIDGAAAVARARSYDVTAPRAVARAHRRGRHLAVRVEASRDRTEAGRRLEGGVRYALLTGGRAHPHFAVKPQSRPFHETVSLPRGRRIRVVVTVCDRVGNCGVKRLGNFGGR